MIQTINLPSRGGPIWVPYPPMDIDQIEQTVGRIGLPITNETPRENYRNNQSMVIDLLLKGAQ